jgi:hypothetical protein
MPREEGEVVVEDNAIADPGQLAGDEEEVLEVATDGVDVAGDPQAADDDVVDAVNVDDVDVPEDEEVGAAVIGDPAVVVDPNARSIVKAQDANGLLVVVEDCGEEDGYDIADMDVELGVLVVVDAGNGSDWNVEVEMEDDVEVEHVDVRADMNGHVIVDTRGIVEDPDSCSPNSSSSGCLVTTPSLPASSACSSNA